MKYTFPIHISTLKCTFSFKDNTSYFSQCDYPKYYPKCDNPKYYL